VLHGSQLEWIYLLVVYLTILSISQANNQMMVSNELERKWSCLHLNYYPRICPETMRNSTKTSVWLVDVLAENRPEQAYLLVTNQKQWYLFQPAVCQEIIRRLDELAARPVLHLVILYTCYLKRIVPSKYETLYTWSSTYDRPHLRPQKNNKLINKLGCATEDTHNPGVESNKRWLKCKSF
jgi:hypothetical protein